MFSQVPLGMMASKCESVLSRFSSIHNREVGMGVCVSLYFFLSLSPVPTLTAPEPTRRFGGRPVLLSAVALWTVITTLIPAGCGVCARVCECEQESECVPAFGVTCVPWTDSTPRPQLSRGLVGGDDARACRRL